VETAERILDTVENVELREEFKARLAMHVAGVAGPARATRHPGSGSGPARAERERTEAAEDDEGRRGRGA
jgi:hypothetical protein